MAIFLFKREQFIPAKIDEVWDFVSSPQNLSKITPPYMGFRILNEAPEKMYRGMLISYRVSPFPGIPMLWVSEITHMSEKVYFVDEQRIGPYRLWHHEHHLKPVEGGVLMSDIVSYSPPLGVLGRIANALFIQKQLNGIFEYR